MQILPIVTPRLGAGDDIGAIFFAAGNIVSGDIIVISSKAIATTEGAAVDVSSLTPSPEAEKLAKAAGQDSRFTESILREMRRMNGVVASVCPYAILTSLKPDGLGTGRILCPNAGMDQSNIADGFAIGWPVDPVSSTRKLKKELEALLGRKPGIGVIISDSCCRPGRLGVTALALTCAGVDPFKSEIGTLDLYGAKLRVTREARADQLATVANAVMGNAHQSTPAAIIRSTGIPLSGFSGWVDGIDPEDDLFQGAFSLQ